VLITRGRVAIAVAVAALSGLVIWLIAALPARDTSRSAPEPLPASASPSSTTPALNTSRAPEEPPAIRLTGAMRGDQVLDSGTSRAIGQVTSLNGGAVQSITEGGQALLRFPAAVCRSAPCPQVAIELPEPLDPGDRPFSFGADVRLTTAAAPDAGMNIFQQGLAAEHVGQWKLQLDYGHPSCRFSDGQNAVVVPKRRHDAAFKLEVGVWYSLRCARTTSEVTLTITRRGSPEPMAATATARLGAISPKGTPTIGAKKLGADRTDLQTDQYHGDLANIWWTRG
jgi:hypothetical protein